MPCINWIWTFIIQYLSPHFFHVNRKRPHRPTWPIISIHSFLSSNSAAFARFFWRQIQQRFVELVASNTGRISSNLILFPLHWKGTGYETGSLSSVYHYVCIPGFADSIWISLMIFQMIYRGTSWFDKNGWFTQGFFSFAWVKSNHGLGGNGL